ncbi:alpha/beta hydrolase [Mumia sp.]|uniref:alpha/beta hydrolase family protein n=1 Tax=Mumia sp. TaxID=1965300 RepID=UPI00260F1D2B|nr:alpha/beta hydrolase [Mumia sp.]MDD9350304.1 alpha/beta hydrolase [Mumia sp.]
MKTAIGTGVTAAALVLTGLVGSPADAQSNPFERGPAPTASSLRARSGPYATTSTSVSGVAVSGFGGGRIYYPTTTSDGTFGGVVLAPGFTAYASTYAGLAERVASHGFVVFAIDTNSTGDFPPSRGDQMLRALDYLVQNSSVRSRVDASRLAVAGHSMGGGGTLEAANDRPSLQAAVPLQPWHSTKSWSNIDVPTMIIGAESDSIASVSSHSERFYTSLNADETAYVELNSESHMAAATNPDDQAYAMISWLKRFVDDDTRYESMLCPPPSSSDYSEWRDTCPGPGGGTTPPTTTPPPTDECEWWEWWC